MKNDQGDFNMETKDVADLFIQTIDKIHFYWNFYVVFLIALIGSLVSNKSPLSPSLKLLITTGYIVFVLMNMIALYSTYTVAEALRSDLLAMDGARALPHVYAEIENLSFLGQRTATLWIHFVIGVSLLTVVWRGEVGGITGKKRSRDNTPTRAVSDR